MAESSTVSPTIDSEAKPGPTGLILVCLLILAVWAELVFKLWIDWQTNAQYEFGPFVPLFIAFLTFQRWKDRPSPSAESGGSFSSLAALAGCLLFILPIRLIQEANPEWRPLNWVHAGCVIAVTLLLATRLGGRRWGWHFAPPLLLILFALPWPLETEQTVIQSMARMVAFVTTEILNWIGIPALQNGNVIQVPTGSVGVNDACSGVRSLAGTLMAACFFGEFYRLNALKRIALLIGGVMIAFLLNIVRAFTLAWIAAKMGGQAIDNYHDQTGLIIFCAAFGILWFVGEKLNSSDVATSIQSDQGVPMRRLQPPFLVACLLWLLAVEGATEYWYRTRERNLPHFATLDPDWPAEGGAFRFINVSDEARAILRYSDGRSAMVNEPGELQMQFFFFRWDPGRSSAQLAVLHRPDICMQASGLTLISRGQILPIRLGSVTIPFEAFIFDSEGHPMYVFRTLIEDRRTPGTTTGFDQSITGRLLSTWHGRRNLGQKLLQVAVVGAVSQQAALAHIESRLPRFIRVTE